jgi:hypothetical protein
MPTSLGWGFYAHQPRLGGVMRALAVGLLRPPASIGLQTQRGAIQLMVLPTSTGDLDGTDAVA